jgi:hypothetical protein
MDESIKKRVDESWKEQVEREKHTTPPPGKPAEGVQPEAAEPRSETAEVPEARWDLFVSGLAMEALVAMGDMAHPVTRKPALNLPRAKYLVDLLGVLEEKTKGNLSIDEERLLTDALYQLRMRYLNKTGG